MQVPFLDLKMQYARLKPIIDREIHDVLESASFVHGEWVHRFEREFAAYLDVKHVIGVANGTDALYLSLRACCVGAGDEVITAANTFVATVEAITATGADVVLVDVDPFTYTLDPSLVEAAITARTRAIIPVHLYGQPADMGPILSIADRHHLFVIEDACQAHGARYQGQRVGGLGTVGCFSCYPGKNLGAYGDAGIIATNDDDLAARIRLLSNHGSIKKYHHEIDGWNSRLDSIQAAVLLAKLPHLDDWNEARREHASRYERQLGECDVEVPRVYHGDHVWHLYVIEADDRDGLAEGLRQAGIGNGIHYPEPVHLTPAFRRLGWSEGSFPVTERAAKRILSVPMYPELSTDQIDYVTDTIASLVRSNVLV